MAYSGSSCSSIHQQEGSDYLDSFFDGAAISDKEQVYASGEDAAGSDPEREEQEQEHWTARATKKAERWTTRTADTSFSDFSTFLSVGYKKKKAYGDYLEVEVSFDGYFPPDEYGNTVIDNFEFEDKFKVSWKLSDHVRIYNIGEIYRIKQTEFYKGKVGIEYEF